jgi:diacylglycerol kinase
MIAIALPLADTASDVAAGAVLTLVVPLALLIVVLVWWYVSLRRAR